MKNFSSTLTIVCFILSLSLTSNVIAQDISNAECGTVVTQENLNYYNSLKNQIEFYEQEYFDLIQNRSSTAITSVPIKAHIIRTSAGTGGLSEAQLNAAIDNMNDYYANALMEFYLCEGINYIDDTAYYDYETNQENALTSANNVSGLINIYFANSVTSSSSGGGLCGYAYLPGGPDTILMDNGCAINGSTLIHEVGHFFSLLHTHGPSNSTLTTELVDGSNCDTDGDYICDTPADPQLGYGNVNTACIYYGTDTDANGDTFVPDPTNIMSYSRKECRTYLSPQQYARFYASFQTARNYFACPSFNVDLAADYTRDCDEELIVTFNDNSTGATSWEWDVDGDDVIDYTVQNPVHTYSPGNYDVALTISDGSNTITKVFSNLIKFETEITNTTQIDLTLVTDNWPAETRWEFRDGNTGDILYSFGPYNDPADDYSTFNYTFDVIVGNCYEFEIFDSYGDGICCASGNGSYELRADDDSIIASGGAIGFGESTFISNETLSTPEFTASSIKLFPNPASSVLTIQVQNSDLPESISMYTILGQNIVNKRISSISDLTIDVSELNDGMYFIKLNKGSRTISLPFIKN